MKRSIIMILSGVFCAALSTDLKAEPVTVSTQSPWKSENQSGIPVYSGTAPQKGYPSLRIKAKVQPNCIYILHSKLKSPAIPTNLRDVILAVNQERTGRFSYFTTSAWNSYLTYIKSGKKNKLAMSFYFDPGSGKSVSVKNIHLEKAPPELLSGNLLPDGDFETTEGISPFWRPAPHMKYFPQSIVASKDFLSGKKCMQVVFNPENSKSSPGICSIQLPVTPGKDFKLTFWAKSGDSSMGIKVSVQAWSPFGHQGKHFFKSRKFKINPEWNEYSIDVSVSNDTEQYPDLNDGMMFISINGNPGQKGTMYLDGMNFSLQNKD